MKIQKDSLIAVLGYLKANRTAQIGARIPAIALNTLQAVIDSLDEDAVPVKASRLRDLSSALGHPSMIAAVDGDSPADALVEVAAISLLRGTATTATSEAARMASLPSALYHMREINYINAAKKFSPPKAFAQEQPDENAPLAYMEPLAWLGTRNGMNMFTSSCAVALENRDIYDAELISKAAAVEAAKAHFEQLQGEVDKYKKLAAHWESGFADLRKYSDELEQTNAARVLSVDQVKALDIVLTHFDGDPRVDTLRTLRETCCIRNDPAFDLVAHLVRQMQFSLKTFGPGPRLGGITSHIEKELIELRDEGGPLSEWVDVIILGFDGAWRSIGLPGDQMVVVAMHVINAIVQKQSRNERRAWPDWHNTTQDAAIEHVRTPAELARQKVPTFANGLALDSGEFVPACDIPYHPV